MSDISLPSWEEIYQFCSEHPRTTMIYLDRSGRYRILGGRAEDAAKLIKLPLVWVRHEGKPLAMVEFLGRSLNRVMRQLIRSGLRVAIAEEVT